LPKLLAKDKGVKDSRVSRAASQCYKTAGITPAVLFLSRFFGGKPFESGISYVLTGIMVSTGKILSLIDIFQ
jgi:hypothetical protein